MSWKRSIIERTSDMLVLGDRNTICFWSIQPFRLAERIENAVDSQIWSLIELDNNTFASGSTGNIDIWSLEKKKSVGSIAAHTNTIFQLNRLSENRIASCSLDRTVKVWTLSDLGEESVRSIASISLKGHQKCVRSLVATPYNYLISGSWDKDVRVWDVSQEACVQVFKKHFNKVTCVGYLNHENQVFSGGEDKRVHIWSLKAHKLVDTIKTRSAVTSLCFQSNHSFIVGEQSGKISIFDIRNIRQPTKSIAKAHSGSIFNLSTCTSSLFSSCSSDSYVRIWNYKSGSKVKEFGDSSTEVHAMMRLKKNSSTSSVKKRRTTPRKRRKKKTSFSHRKRVPRSAPPVNRRKKRFNLKSEVREKGGVVFRSPLFSPPMHPGSTDDDENEDVGKETEADKTVEPVKVIIAPKAEKRKKQKKSSRAKSSPSSTDNRNVLFENSFLGDIQQKLKEEISLREEELENMERLNEENHGLRKTGKSLRERLRKSQDFLQSRIKELKSVREEISNEKKKVGSLRKEVNNLNETSSEQKAYIKKLEQEKTTMEKNFEKEKKALLKKMEKEKKTLMKKLEGSTKKLEEKKKENQKIRHQFRKVELLRKEEEQEKEDWRGKYQEILEKMENCNRECQEIQSANDFLKKKLESQEQKNEQLFNQFQTHLKKSRHKILTAKSNIEELHRSAQNEKRNVRILEKRNETLFLKLKNVLSTYSRSQVVPDQSSWEGRASQKMNMDFEMKMDQKSRQIEAIRQQLGWLKKEQTTNARLLSRNRVEIQYLQLRRELINRRTDVLLPSSSSTGVISSKNLPQQQQKNNERKILKLLEEKRGRQVDLERRAIPTEELEGLEKELQSSLKILTQIRGALQVCDPDIIYTCVHTQYILPALKPFIRIAPVKYVRWKERLAIHANLEKVTRKVNRDGQSSLSTSASSHFPFIQIFGYLEKKDLKTVFYLVECCPVQLFDYFRSLEEKKSIKKTNEVFSQNEPTSRVLEDVDRTKLQLLRQAAKIVSKLHDVCELGHLDLQPRHFRVVKDDRNLPRVKLGGYRYSRKKVVSKEENEEGDKKNKKKKKIKKKVDDRLQLPQQQQQTQLQYPKIGRRNERYMDPKLLDYLSYDGRMNRQSRDPYLMERDVYSFGIILFHAMFLHSSSLFSNNNNNNNEKKSSYQSLQSGSKIMKEEFPFDKFKEKVLKDLQPQQHDEISSSLSSKSHEEFSLLQSLRNYLDESNKRIMESVQRQQEEEVEVEKKKKKKEEEEEEEEEDVKHDIDEEEDKKTLMSVEAVKKISAFQVLVDESFFNMESLSPWKSSLLKLIQRCLQIDEERRPSMKEVVKELIEIEKLQMRNVSEKEEEERRRRSLGDDDLSSLISLSRRSSTTVEEVEMSNKNDSDDDEEEEEEVKKEEGEEEEEGESFIQDEVKGQGEEEEDEEGEEEEEEGEEEDDFHVDDLDSEEEGEYETEEEEEEEEEEGEDDEDEESQMMEQGEQELYLEKEKEKVDEPILFEIVSSIEHTNKDDE